MHLNVFVSQSCFSHCKGCYSYSREEAKGKKVTTEKLTEFFRFAYDEGVNKVTFCGGDPLTREDIITLLERTKNIGFNISLDTLGSPIIKNVESDNRTIVKQLDPQLIAQLVDTIGIPIDGSTNEIFKRFRQSKSDMVKEQLAICQKLHEFGAHICINTVAHKGNLEDAYNLARLVKEMNYIEKWQIFQYMPLGKFGYKNKASFEITMEQFDEFKQNVINVFENDTSKLQFKDLANRKNKYMLIDNSGNAWIPSTDTMSTNNCSYVLNGKTIIGNINRIEDWNQISTFLDKNEVQPYNIHDLFGENCKTNENIINTVRKFNNLTTEYN